MRLCEYLGRERINFKKWIKLDFLLLVLITSYLNVCAEGGTSGNPFWDYTLLSNKQRFFDGSAGNFGDYSNDLKNLIKFFSDTTRISQILNKQSVYQNNKLNNGLEQYMKQVSEQSDQHNIATKYMGNIQISKYLLNLLEQIDNLPISEESYSSKLTNSVLEKFKAKYQRKDFQEFVIAYTYLAQHFFSLPEVYQSRLFYIENLEEFQQQYDDDSTLNNNVKELIADYCVKWDMIPIALKKYLEVTQYYAAKRDWGKAETIREKIADMLVLYGRGTKEYYEKAYSYFNLSYLSSTAGSDNTISKISLKAHAFNINKTILFEPYFLDHSIYSGLEQAKYGYNLINNNNPLSVEFLSELLSLVGDCFYYSNADNHFEIASFYYENALKCNLTFQSDIGELTNLLLKLSSVSAQLKNEKLSSEYLLFAKQLAEKKEDDFIKTLLNIKEAEILIIEKKYFQSIASLKKVTENASIKLLPSESYIIKDQVYRLLSEIYSYNLNNKDSSMYYYKQQMLMKTMYGADLNDLEMVEKNNELSLEINSKEQEIYSKKQELNKAKWASRALLVLIAFSIYLMYRILKKLAKANGEYVKLKQNLGGLKFDVGMKQDQVDFLTKQNDRLKEQRISLQSDINELKSDKELYSKLFFIAAKNARESYIHSAISRVLIRCLSHNIGSHVLSKFIDKSKVGRRDLTGQYQTCLPEEIIPKQYCQMQLIANFNEYIKVRMDFLADIATSMEPYMETPMYLMRDIIQGLDNNRILLNRISGVGPEISYRIGVEISNNPINSFDDNNDVLLSIPNGILGSHAFYILIENIIRNIYKHGNPDQAFTVQIEVKESKEDLSLYEVNIYDTLWKQKNVVKQLVRKRNRTFNTSVLDKESNNQLRNINLGSIEMKVCAAYLRGLPVDVCDNETYNIPDELICPDGNSIIDPFHHLICAYAQRTRERSPGKSQSVYSLGYKFFIAKPKQVLVVSSSGFEINGKTTETLKTHGFCLTRPEEINEEFTSYHLIMYLDKDISEDLVVKFPAQLPKRVVSYNDAINSSSPGDFIEKIWLQHNRNISPCYNKFEIQWQNFSENVDLTQNQEATISHKTFIDDHHHRWLCRNCKEKSEAACTNKGLYTALNGRCKPLANYSYYDIACNHTLINKYINAGFFDNKLLQSEYVECIMTKILVIDERIQSSIVKGRKHYNTVPLCEYFEQQGVFIPLVEYADLENVTLGQLSNVGEKPMKTEADRIRGYINQHIDSVTFCVMHLTLLEKMLLPGMDKTEFQIESIINKILIKPEHRRKLIITSNRGGAKNIPGDISFVPFPLIQSALETLFDKFVLTKILYNSRKCK